MNKLCLLFLSLIQIKTFGFLQRTTFVQHLLLGQRVQLAAKSDDNASLFASSATKDQGAPKKKKKNKYAKFSKVESAPTQEDPLEALIKESEAKLKQLREEKERKKRSARVTPSIKVKRLEFPNNKDIDPYDPTTFGYIEIGIILGAHGVHGYTKVQGSTDFPERLTSKGMPLHFKPRRKRAPRRVTLANGKMTGPDSFLVQLQGIHNRTEAEKLKGGTLYYATQQDTVKKDDDLLLSDLVGLQVRIMKEDENNYDEEDDSVLDYVVGTVGGAVLAEEMCAIPGLGQDMLEIIVEHSANADADIVPGTPKDLVLIPMVPQIVKQVDFDSQTVWIDPPEGLLDLTYVREEKVRIKGLLPPAKD